MSSKVQKIIDTVAQHYGLKPDQIMQRTHKRAVARPRQVAMYLCRKHTRCSFPDLANRFGGKHHTTILYGAERIEDLIANDRDLAIAVNMLDAKIGAEFDQSGLVAAQNRNRVTVEEYIRRAETLTTDAPPRIDAATLAWAMQAVSSGDRDVFAACAAEIEAEELAFKNAAKLQLMIRTWYDTFFAANANPVVIEAAEAALKSKDRDVIAKALSMFDEAIARVLDRAGKTGAKNTEAEVAAFAA